MFDRVLNKPLYFYVLQTHVYVLKNQIIPSKSNDFLISYNHFYFELKYQEMQRISNCQTKSIFTRFKFN